MAEGVSLQGRCSVTATPSPTPSHAHWQAEWYRSTLRFPNNYSLTKRMGECLLYDRAEQVGWSRQPRRLAYAS